MNGFRCSDSTKSRPCNNRFFPFPNPISYQLTVSSCFSRKTRAKPVPVKPYTRTGVFSQRPTFPYKATTKMLYWYYMLKGHEMPANALDGGSDKRSGPKRVIARAWYEGNLVPGYVKQETGVGYFVVENDVVTRDEFEVLVSTNVNSYAWGTNFSPDVTEIASSAMKGGSTFSCDPLYIGCMTIRGVELSGYIKNSTCYVALDTMKVVESDTFSILVDLTNEDMFPDDAAIALDDEWDELSDHESEDNGIPKITDVRTIAESVDFQDTTSVETNRPKIDNEIDYEKTGRIGLVELNSLLEKKKTANVENMSELDREEYLATMSDDELAEYLAEGGTL